MSKNRLYFYGFEGKAIRSGDASLISEIKLPPFSRELRGKCAFLQTNFKKVRTGTMLTLAFGDPRVIKNARLVSKRRKDVPENILIAAKKYSWDKILTFKYQGKRFWCNDTDICRLKDL